MIRNVHTRDLGVPAGPFVDRVQELWPPAWGKQEFDRPLGVGADGGHGPIRYRCTEFKPGESITFEFTEVSGTHTLSASGTVIRHELIGDFDLAARLRWALVVRWLHDACLEDLFDNFERAAGREPAAPARWSPWVRLVRRVIGAVMRRQRQNSLAGPS
ncbi:SRPBCC family protein [Lentzea sp. BCCO 10_0061]|uniref:SRPBCC family protein n=1 Tax=Lentzea sokolovensis TaxID=3095429 RepID=A0ABU4V075_9PSEU|nr:SRPBCC family protein [Lentzea sp. BCCO 10_0061]MDX8145178.1 SRPBCC family protein [Lentzea sp. BCCO 10_0061]